MKNGMRALTLLLALLLLPPPVPVFAQQPARTPAGQGIGVVTALQGEATVTRGALPQPTSLRFRDDVFFRDVINTRERSTVRLLLGGKGVVTVREQSQLTLDEAVTSDGARRSSISLFFGKIGTAIARSLMGPGEEVEVRTPNAVAAVRGTVLVAEYIPPKQSAEGPKPILLASTDPRGLLAQATPPAGGQSNFFVLSGSVTVTPEGQPPVTVGAMQTVSVTATPAGIQVGSVAPMTAQQAQQAAQGLSSAKTHTGEAEGGKAAQAQAEVAAVVANAVVQATTGTPTPTPTTTAPTTTTTGTPPPPPPPAPTPPPPAPSTANMLPAGSVLSIGGGLNLGVTSGVSLASFTGGSANAMTPLAVTGPGTATITGPLITAIGGPISHTGSLVTLTGGSAIVGAVAESAPLFSVSGTSLTNSGSLLDLDGLSSLWLEGPILGLASGASASLGGALALSGGSEAALGPSPGVLVPSGTSLSTAGFLYAVSGSDTTLASYGGGALASVQGGSLTLGAPLLSVATDGVAHLAGPALLATNATVSGDGLAQVVNATLDLNGSPLLSAASSTLTFGAPLVYLEGGGLGGSIYGSGAQPLFALTGGSLTLTEFGQLLDVVADYISLEGSLLAASGTTINAAAASGPLVALTNSNGRMGGDWDSFTTAKPMIDLVASSSLTAATPLLGVSGSTLDLMGPLLATSGSPVMSTSPTAGLASIGSYLRLYGYGGYAATGLAASGSDLSFQAPLFSVTNGGLYSYGYADSYSGAVERPLAALNGGSLTLTGNGALLDAQNSYIYSPGGLLWGSGTTISAGSASGPLVRLRDDSSLSVYQGDVFKFENSTVTARGLVSINNSSLDIGYSYGEMDGSLLAASNSSLTFTGPMVSLVEAWDSIHSNGSQPFYGLSGGSLTLTGTGGLLTVDNGYVSLAGPLLVADGTAINATGTSSPLIRLTNYTDLSHYGTGALVSLTGGSLTLATPLLEATEHAYADLQGSLLQATNTSVASSASTAGLAYLLDGSLYVNSAPLLDSVNSTLQFAAPLVTVAESPESLHVYTPGGAVFRLDGGSLTLTGAGSLLDLDSSFAESYGHLLVATRVEAASAPVITSSGTSPLVWLRNYANLGVGYGGENGGNLIDLDQGARLTTASPVARVEGMSSLTIRKDPDTGVGGSLVHLAGGSRLEAGAAILEIEGGWATLEAPIVSLKTGSELDASGPILSLNNASLTGTYLLGSDGDGNRLSLTGSLLTLQNANLTLHNLSNTPPGTDLFTLNLAANQPLVAMAESNLNLTEAGAPMLSLGFPSGTPFAGTILHASNGLESSRSILTAGFLLELAGGSFTATDPLIRLQGMDLAQTGLGPEPLILVYAGADWKTALSGPLLDASGGSLNLTRLLEVAEGAELVSQGAGGTLILKDGVSLQAKGLVSVFGDLTLGQLAGPLLSARESSLTLTGPLVEVVSAYTLSQENATQPLIGLTDSTLTLTADGFGGGGSLLRVDAGSVGLAGGFLAATGTDLHAGGSPAPLVEVTNHGYLYADGHLVSLSGGSLDLASPLLAVGGFGLVELEGSVLKVSGTSVTGTGSASGLARVEEGSLYLYGAPLLDSLNSNLSFGGPLVYVGSPFSLHSTALDTPLLRLSGGSLALTGAGGLASFTNASVEVLGSLLLATREGEVDPATITALDGGPLLRIGSASEVILGYGGFASGYSAASVVELEQGSQLSTSGPIADIFGGSSLSVYSNAGFGGSLVSLDSGASLLASGTLLEIQTGGSASFAGPLFALRGGSQITATGGPVVRVVGGSLSAGGGFGSSDGAGNVVTITGLPGSSALLLEAEDAVITFGPAEIPQAGVIDSDQIRFIAPDGVPLYRFTNSSLTDTTPYRPLLEFALGPAESYAGLLLVAADSSLNLAGPLLGLYQGDQATTTTMDPLIQLTNSTVSTGAETLLIHGGQLRLAGPLLSMAGGGLTTDWSLLQVTEGGSLESTSDNPLLWLQGPASPLPITLSSETPGLIDIRGVEPSGPDSSVSLTGTGNLLTLDNALLASAAHIVRMLRGSLTVNGDPTMDHRGAIHLLGSQVATSGAAFTLDRSTLQVNHGPLLSVTNGSVMTVSGNFADLTGGSRIFVQNGPLISVSGTGSSLDVLGALISFGGTGNQVIINNTITPTATVTSNGVNIPVSATTGGSINIGSNAIVNPTGNTFSVTGSAIEATGGGAVTISNGGI